MSKKAPLATAPAQAELTPDEQKFFDTKGGEIDADGGADVAVEVTDAAPATTSDEAPAASDGGKKDVVEAAKPPEKTVPHAALVEEREARKQAQEDLRRLQDRTNQLFERFVNQPQQAAQQQVNGADKVPDPDQDPTGYMLWALKSVAERQSQIDQRFADQDNQSKTGQALAQLQNEALSAEADFRQATPDYDKAAQFMQQSRLNELKAIGYSPADAIAQVRAEALGIAARGKQIGKNPAEMIYEMAKLRGYQAQQEEPTPDAQATVANAVQTAEQKLQAVSNGQRQTRTLSQTNGSAPQPMTAQRLMEMSANEFEAYKAKNPAQFRNLMGA